MSARRSQPAAASSDTAFRALLRAYGLIKRIQEPYFARFGITVSQWGVLRALHRAAGEGLDGLRLTDLGARLIIRPASVTGVIDRLQRLGLVARTASDSDLRVKYVRLTPSGLSLVERVLEDHRDRIGALLDGLTPKEQEHLHRLLVRLESHLKTFEEHEDAAPDGASAAASPADRNRL